jgi:peptide/nickel transport system substrate-binding protein
MRFPVSRRDVVLRSVLLAAAGALAGLAGRSAAAQERRGGGTLRIGLRQIDSPIFAVDVAGVAGLGAVHVFETLLTPGPDNAPRPYLAERWDQVSPTLYRFALRRDVQLHDGTRFDATVAKHSVDRNLRGVIAGELDRIREVRVIDPGTIEIECTRPFPLLPVRLAEPTRVPILSPNDRGTRTALGLVLDTPTIGTGPFRVERQAGRSARDRFTLVRNEAYWRRDEAGGRLPRPERVVWRSFTTRESWQQAWDDGELDLFSDPYPGQDLYNVPRHPNLVLTPLPQPEFLISMWFDCSRPPFDNPHCRRAVQLAIDRQAIVSGPLAGRARPWSGPIPPTSWAYDAAASAQRSLSGSAARDAARSALAEAGLPDGFAFVLADFVPHSGTLPEVLLRQLAEVGIKATLGRPAHAEMVGGVPEADDPDVPDLLTRTYRTGSRGNRGSFTNSGVDRALADLQGASSLADLTRLCRVAERLIVEQAPRSWVVAPDTVHAHTPRVTGVDEVHLNGQLRLEKVMVAS